MEPESVLLEGILALQRGERERAGALLVRYTRTNPQSAEGWLWLSRCLDDPKEIDYCLHKARKIDPALADSFNAQPDGVTTEAGGGGAGTAAVSQQPGIRQRAFSKIGRREMWIGLVVLVLLGAVGGWWIDRERQAERARLAPLVVQARPFIDNCGETCDYAQGVEMLDQVIRSDPNRADARRLRAVALLRLAETTYEPEQSLKALNSAREDIDRYIGTAQPADVRDFVLRYRIYKALAMRQDLRADAEKLLRTGLENLAVARQLGDESPEQADMPLLYTLLGKCDEAIEDLERQQADLLPDESPAVLLEWESIWLVACEGDLSGALDTLERSLAADPEDLRANDLRLFERALITYENGDADAALADLDDQITERPDSGGERYFLRALILYEQGFIDLAEEDLAAGEANSWERQGLNAYVRFLMAQDAAQNADALQLLQQAEAATLPGMYTPMLERYRAELADLGAAPLEQTPAADLRVTPISIEQ